MMYYTCENCFFTFCRSGDVEQCPDCGKYNLRPATEKEISDFQKELAEKK